MRRVGGFAFLPAAGGPVVGAGAGNRGSPRFGYAGRRPACGGTTALRGPWMPGGPAASALLRLAVAALLAVRERAPPGPVAPCAAEIRCECVCADASRRELPVFIAGVAVGAALVVIGVLAARPARPSPATALASPPPSEERVVRYRPRHG